ncbi:TetR/AcrR family transcriptional regulator [Enterococcus saccharolyticus]|uniref:HTH tetR-type domain-containing protein n=1 Tax=Enterococcus saccharolyticus subsp. saccharolyticus ATCC 43076 TaxID=1139996 RepID=S0NRL5_9ENTE|nr:TetR/AcrR family transcriptional regulator [Enterococcus saccharolyticus]EOT29979.1 hypothetical protein OMQ_00671 [Enterococcus saccharolyticus subsp. saccharolyticus ATCC 43076]EOT80525.1 hypothetical protein I572_01052 [Enterococcus saccharolyticus subsp. saccharolyticus ATCC 43076]OJG90064.1 hypothetical protein RV16_GL001874 [Enterococcus saccharolyticus]
MPHQDEIDIRTKRTRKLIITAFMELLHEKTFDSIRIADITNKATINRATFYNYFTDKYQLLDTITEETLLSHFHKNLTDDDVFSPDFVKKIYLTLTDFHMNMSYICHKNHFDELSLYTSPILRTEITNTLLKAIQLKYPQEDSARLSSLAAIISWYIIGLSYEWKHSKQPSAEEFFNQFREDYERLILNFG